MSLKLCWSCLEALDIWSVFWTRWSHLTCKKFPSMEVITISNSCYPTFLLLLHPGDPHYLGVPDLTMSHVSNLLPRKSFQLATHFTCCSILLLCPASLHPGRVTLPGCSWCNSVTCGWFREEVWLQLFKNMALQELIQSIPLPNQSKSVHKGRNWAGETEQRSHHINDK